jgi:hypothetical protein
MDHVVRITRSDLGDGPFNDILFKLSLPQEKWEFITEIALHVKDIEFDRVD